MNFRESVPQGKPGWDVAFAPETRTRWYPGGTDRAVKALEGREAEAGRAVPKTKKGRMPDPLQYAFDLEVHHGTGGASWPDRAH